MAAINVHLFIYFIYVLDGGDRDGDEEDDDGDDDDHLFEFDLCDGDENKSGGADEEDRRPLGDDVTKISSPTSASLPELPARKFSIGSDCSASSSGGGCQHRKKLDDAATEAADRTAGFVGSLFGSRSSGLGSERRSSQVRRFFFPEYRS